MLAQRKHAIVSALTALLMIVACSAPAVTPAVISVTIDQTNPSGWEGTTLQLTATVETIGGASTAVTWASSNTSVATINPTTGLVTGVASGTTTITTTSTADTSKKGSTTLTVREPLSLTVNTTLASDGKTVTLELGNDPDATVDWGDGTTTSTTASGGLTHTYATAGAYDITIRGTLTRFPRTHLITSLNAWGDFDFTSLAGAFSGSDDLVSVPDALPASVTDLSRAFAGTRSFDHDIGHWDVSNVTNMSGMFAGSEAFTHDLGAWDVSNVTDMSMMFRSSYVAAQGLSTWDVSSVTNMSYMLADIPFNEDIGGWDVSSVTDMSGMFSWSWYFDHDIGEWDVSNVTDMSAMFEGTEQFDQDIGRWDVSNVANMDNAFSGAEVFNQDLSGWCVLLIPIEPNGFSSWAQTLPLPIWGTCPGG